MFSSVKLFSQTLHTLLLIDGFLVHLSPLVVSSEQKYTKQMTNYL